MPDASSPIAFVTGGTGFVGSHLVEELIGRGYAVRALVRSSEKWLEGMPVEAVAGDLHDAEALRRGADGADLVAHVAGLTRARDQATLDRANVDGTRAVLDAVSDTAGSPRVLVTSSLEAMGPNRVGSDGRPVPATEADQPQPVSMYGISKARMEDAIRRDYEGMGVTVIRPPAVYGPREADLYTMAKGAARGLFPIVGRADVPRLSMVHVRDLVRGMADLAEAPEAAGETFFVGTPGVSWAQVRAALEAALGRKTLALQVPGALVGAVGTLAERVGGLVGTLPPLTADKAEAARHAWICSSDKAAQAVGYAPEVGLVDGWTETIAWYRRQGWL